ncbi:MAG TPA: cation transporter, partial [Candidatus Nitrosocosmicus sp.]|nr:cation transporter [Candidatus Nitrosocosmicus sp.]
LERGVVSLLNPQSHQIDNILISYIILVISFVFEANALRIAFSLFKKTIAERGNRLTFSSLTKEFKESKDTSVLTVLVEDTSALIGITVAAAALFLTQVTGNRIFDSIGSLIIGLILMAFAVFLAKENKELLIGESISRRDYRRITAIVSKIPEVDRIISIRSMYLATDDVLIAIEVSLIDNLDTDKIEFVIDNIENKVREIIPYADPSKIYVEPSRDDSSSNSEIKSRYSKI